MPGMMEKGPELLGKNRSANGSAKSPAGGGGGASSTNGGLHYSEPESGCSSDDEHDVGMRVGAEYQARIPEFDPDFSLPNFYLLPPDCISRRSSFLWRLRVSPLPICLLANVA